MKINLKNNISILQSRAWSLSSILLLFIIIISFLLISFFLPIKESISQQLTCFCLFGAIVTSLILYLNYRKENLSFGLSANNLIYVIWTPLIYLLTIILLLIVGIINQYLLTNLFNVEIKPQEILEKFKELEKTYEIIIFGISSVVIAPLYEELLFRGIIFPKLIQKTNFLTAVILSSLIFAILHFHLSALLPLFSLSLILSLIYLQTLSLWPCIFLHALFNLISIILIKFVS